MEIGWDKVSLEREDHATAVVWARDDGGLGSGKENSGKIGERFRKWRKGVGIEWENNQRWAKSFACLFWFLVFVGVFWGRLGKLGWVWIHSLKGKEKMSPVLTTLTSECPWDVQASSCTQASEHRGRANRDLMCDMWPSGHWLRPKWIVNIGKSIEEYYYLM